MQRLIAAFLTRHRHNARMGGYIIMASLNSWSYDMLLQKNIPRKSLSFVVLGDSHIVSLGRNADYQHILDENGELYKKILNRIVSWTLAGKINPLFILHGGDAVDAGHEENFDAFVTVSKEILQPAALPIFVALGNHDYDLSDLTPNHFRHYIGNLRETILIPHTNVKIIRLSTHYSGQVADEDYYGYFAEEDINLLPKDDFKYHYLIDFHIPLRVCCFHNTQDDHHVLSMAETCKFLSNINPNVCGVFCHHRHIHYSCFVNYYYQNQLQTLPFIISGCAGNHTCTDPHFYYVTLNLKNYTFTATPYYVFE